MAHDRPQIAVLPAPPAATDADQAEREFWLAVRRSFLTLIDAIEQRHRIPSVIDQYERRQAAKKS